MPRAHRHVLPGRTYHVTHRCHDRAFLLKFGRDRQAYRDWIRDGLDCREVALLNYCITCNHVHLLLRAAVPEELGRFMQYVAGGSAQAYNLRKKRSGAFWSDRYHATMIEDGEHLWRCMMYIDLNMVRAGVVRHPREWNWTGWGELVGERRRNRIVDIATVINVTRAGDAETFRTQYAETLESALNQAALKRESCWTESVAVGSEPFIEVVERELLSDYTRKRLERIPGSEGELVLREASTAYGAENDAKNRAIEPLRPVETGLVS